MEQENRAHIIMHRATSLIAAGALSLTLVPSIAFAENGSEEKTAPETKQVAQAEPDAEAGESTFEAQSKEGTDQIPDTVSKNTFESEEQGQTNGSASTEGSEVSPLSLNVAKIGTTEYATFDEAVAAANDNDTIELLKSTTTSGLNLSKNLIIDGGSAKYSLSFNDKGIALWGKSLTFKNTNVSMNGIGSTPYTAEWNWMTIYASKDASLTLDNAALSMDGTGAGNAHAIYFCSNNKLNLENASKLSISNYAQDALEWDGGNGGYNVNISGGSTYISDHNRSGFTGTFYATIDSSTVKVINSTGNGSNGTYYTIKNGSDVLFDSNGAWGMSAWRIDMTEGSKLKATNNGFSGIWTRVLNLDSSCQLDVEANGAKGGTSQNAGIFFQGNGTYRSELAQGANVVIKDNAGCGIYTKQKACNLSIGSATITNNGTGSINEKGLGAERGGGIYNVGTAALGASVQIYNNHASLAGDDLYSTGAGVTSFGKTGSGWILDDCNEAIDGWYSDPENSRWNAHPEADESAYVIAGTEGKTESELALKAAHGLSVDYQYVGEYPKEANKPEQETGLQTLPYYAATQGAVSGWTFDGWYTDESCATKWVDYTPLTGNMTLYGKWTKTAADEPSSAEPTQPGSQQPTASSNESQQATDTEQLAKTGDATLPFGLAMAGIALAAAAVACISRKLLKR